MSNFRPAPDSMVEAVKRRLERCHPGVKLEKKSVKLCPIPGTAFDATIFRYTVPDSKKRPTRVFVAELMRPDLPPIYQAYPVSDDAILNASRILAALFSLSKRIREDPKFERKIIVLR